ncbi:MAG: hypothetical protein LQ342_005391 [Letrouitia transgressa]|nr:MAG: hypothetical protein LQ342_005391 [Letrouitia transgressa]
MAASSASDAQNLISQSSKDDNLDNLHSSSQKNEENQNTHDNDDNAPKEDASKADAPKDDAPKKSWRFWAIIVALSVTGLLTALEATITSTALPTIIDALGGASLYVWVINLYFLTMTAFQPLYGQLADIFGRRYPLILATAIFTLGSGICGGASNIAMLVAGRAIQGIGAGGVNVLIEIVVCDLVPLRERGTYLAIIFGLVALGTALGPVFGGLIVQHTSWRWAFYLNLPIGGAALAMLVFFLQVNWEKETSIMTKLRRIDYVGNSVFVASVVSVLIALSWAGTVYPWSTFRIIVPLILGCVGFVIFLIYEKSSFCVEPTMPVHLFSNRTSLTAFLLTFLHSVVTIWALYFLPIYFQGVLGSSPGRSGVQLLPTVLSLIPFAAGGGKLVAQFGRYRPIHMAGYAVMIVGFGLFCLLSATSTTAEWVIYQVIEAAGAGLIIPALLPAVQAPLSDADNALATSTWAFVRSFGMVWGATIPAAIFNNRFDQLAPTRIQDPGVVRLLSGGKAYQHATRLFLDTLPPDVSRQVKSVFLASLKRTWQVAIGFAGFGFVLVSLEKEIKLRKELDTEYGMTERKEKKEESIELEAQPGKGTH